MAMRILLVAPDQADINQDENIRAVTGLHSVHVLNGTVTLSQLGDIARRGRYDVIQFNLHGNPDGMYLSGGERIGREDVVRLARMADAKLLFFNSCYSGRHAAYAVAHWQGAAIFSNVELPVSQAWQMSAAFYDVIAQQQEEGAVDYAQAFLQVDTGEGVYAYLVSPAAALALEPVLKELHELHTQFAEYSARQTKRINGLILSAAIMWAAVVGELVIIMNIVR